VALALQKIQVARASTGGPARLDSSTVISEEWLDSHGDARGSMTRPLVGGIGRIGDNPLCCSATRKRRAPRRMWPRNQAWLTGGFARPCVLMDDRR